MLAKRWYQDRVDSTQRADLSGFWGNEPSLEPGTQISRDFRFPDFSVGTDSGKSGNPGISPGKSGNQEIRRESRPGNPEIREIWRKTRKPDSRYPVCLSFSSRIAGHHNHPRISFGGLSLNDPEISGYSIEILEIHWSLFLPALNHVGYELDNI